MLCRHILAALGSDRLLWIQDDIEDITTLMGEDWFPYGVKKNLAMTQTFCNELQAQGFVKDRLDASTVFTEFEGVMSGT